jgi:hypothetical protein
MIHTKKAAILYGMFHKVTEEAVVLYVASMVEHNSMVQT